MVEQPLDTGAQEKPIDDRSPEDVLHGEARKTFIAVLLTPVYWVGTLMLINVVVALYPTMSTELHTDSTFVFITWSLLALLWTITAIFVGTSHARKIKKTEAMKGLWMAHAASVLGIVYTVLTFALIFAIFTGEDATTRPGW